VRAVSLNQFRLRFGENINRPAALDIEASVVGDNTDCTWGGRVGTRTSRKPSCSRTSIPFITIPLFGAGPCAAICGRQRPSAEAALSDTAGCDLDISKTAVKVTRRRFWHSRGNCSCNCTHGDSERFSCDSPRRRATRQI